MCDAEHRLGSSPAGVEEIKKHPFFEGLDWRNLRNAKAPFVADLTSDDDCRRFDKFEEEEPFYATVSTGAAADAEKKRRQRKDINFVGYTFKKDVEEQKINLVKVLNESLQAELPNSSEQTPSSHSQVSISKSTTVGGSSTPQQKSTEPSQVHSNFYVSSQIGQGGHESHGAMLGSGQTTAGRMSSQPQQEIKKVP